MAKSTAMTPAPGLGLVATVRHAPIGRLTPNDKGIERSF